MGRTTLNISLTAEQQAFIDGRIASGRFTSASEVVRDALRLAEMREAAVQDIREKIEEGWQQRERGEFRDGPTVMSEMKALLQEKLKQKSARGKRKRA